MASTLEVKLITAIAAYAPLNTLLSTRVYDTQLAQGSAFPALVIQLISNPREYVFTNRLATSWARVQFTVWGGQFAAGNQAADQVRAALLTFLDQFNAEGVPGLTLYPCRVVGDRRGAFTQEDTLVFQRLVDAMIFNNELL